MPASYRNQIGGAYVQDRENLRNFKMPVVFTSQTNPSFKNRMTVNCDINPDDDNSLKVNYNIKLTGTTKDVVTGITIAPEWAPVVEDYLDIPENKRYKSESFDAVERDEELKKLFREFISENLYSSDDIELKSFKIINRGVVPTSPDIELALSLRIPDALSSAGNDLIIPVGHFGGVHPRVPEAERTRQTNIYFSAPAQENFDITIDLPDGYEADPESLAALKTMVNNPLGMFYAEAVDPGDGTITVRTRSKINVDVAPAGAWQAYLDISDAEAAFDDAVLILRKKQ